MLTLLHLYTSSFFSTVEAAKSLVEDGEKLPLARCERQRTVAVAIIRDHPGMIKLYRQYMLFGLFKNRPDPVEFWTDSLYDVHYWIGSEKWFER